MRYGDFTLASGKQTDFYIDGKQTIMNPEAAWCLGTLMVGCIKPDVKAIGGLCMGAAPIVGAVSAVSYALNNPVEGFLVRKSLKSHGTQKLIEGREKLKDGTKVCIVEDTCTTGRSVLNAIQKVENEGLKVVQVITVVDRQEGAREVIEKAGYSFHALVLKEELV